MDGTERGAEVVAGLDDEQREAVTVDAEPLRILAGPGSGKTLVLSRRIARRVLDGTADPRHVLCLTFTRKAAGALRDRLVAHGIRDLGPVGTFHAVALAQLRQWSADNGRRPPVVLGHRARFTAALLEELRLAVPDSLVRREIDWARRRELTPERYAELARRDRAGRGVDVDAVAVAYDVYQRRKRRDGLVDLDDLIAETARLLEDDATFRAAQRWRFRHLFVDEFQDVNRPQYRLLRSWLGDRGDLCVVGDPDQAIYRWNGGDPELLTGLHQDLPALTTVELRHNHRSSPAIVEAAAAVLERAPGPSSERPGPPVTVTEAADGDAEAETVATLLGRWQDATGRAARADWSGFAVLARTNAQLAPLAAALERAGIPHRRRGGHGDLRSTEARATIAALRTETTGFVDLVADLRAELDEPDGVAPSEAVIRAAEQYVADHPRATATGPGFAQWLRVMTDDDLAGDDTAVDLLTFHSAKGLEWPVVVVAGCEEGFTPLSVVDPEDMEEERRVFYVALTRAGRELHLTWSRTRIVGGVLHTRRRSRFLDALDAVTVHDTGIPIQGIEAGREVRQIRVGLDDGGEAPDDGSEMHRRLLRWRSAQAAAARVDPAAVLADDALGRLALAATRGEVRTLADVEATTGYGRSRSRRFGDSLLRVCAATAPPTADE